ncbi:hypothetical protein ACLK1T_21985 [Escherichia coli]
MHCAGDVGSYSSVWAEDDIQFDSRFLELKGDTKIDLKRFSSQGYVEPGKTITGSTK